MGFGNDRQDPAVAQSNAIAEQRIQQNMADIDERRRALSEDRLSIIKSDTGQDWVNRPRAGASYKKLNPPAALNPSHPRNDDGFDIGKGVLGGVAAGAEGIAKKVVSPIAGFIDKDIVRPLGGLLSGLFGR